MLDCTVQADVFRKPSLNCKNAGSTLWSTDHRNGMWKLQRRSRRRRMKMTGLTEEIAAQLQKPLVVLKPTWPMTFDEEVTVNDNEISSSIVWLVRWPCLLLLRYSKRCSRYQDAVTWTVPCSQGKVMSPKKMSSDQAEVLISYALTHAMIKTLP